MPGHTFPTGPAGPFGALFATDGEQSCGLAIRHGYPHQVNSDLEGGRARRQRRRGREGERGSGCVELDLVCHELQGANKGADRPAGAGPSQYPIGTYGSYWHVWGAGGASVCSTACFKRHATVCMQQLSGLGDAVTGTSSLSSLCVASLSSRGFG